MSKAPAPQPQSPNQPSVFNALGSYADRIKTANGSPGNAASAKDGKPIAGSSSGAASGGAWRKMTSPNGSSPASPSTPLAKASSSNTASSSASPMIRPTKAAAAPPSSSGGTTAVEEDDGPWETVQSGRNRNKPDQDKKQNRVERRERSEWVERPSRDKVDDERRAASAKPANVPKKPSASAGEKPRTSSTPSNPSKPAWGARPQPTTRTSQPGPDTKQPDSSPSAIATPASSQAQQTPPMPSSPSLVSTTQTAFSPSIGSPHLSAAAESTSTAATSVVVKGKTLDDEISVGQAARGQDETPEDKTPTPANVPAPPPAVNAWDARKKTLAPAAQVANAMPTSPSGSSSLQFGSLPTTSAPSLANKAPTGDGVTIAKNKQKKTSAPAQVDETAWPDVAQAVDITKAAEGKEKQKGRSEDSSVVEEQAAGGKKTKWVPIPQAELTAAADEAAEAKKKLSREEKRRVKGQSVSQPGKARGGSGDRKVNKGEVRIPPIPKPQEATTSSFKPLFGTATTSSTSTDPETRSEEGKADQGPGSVSAPLSRQTTRVSRRGSVQSRTQGSSPAAHTQPLANAGSPGSFVRPAFNNNTAPLPQHSFNPANNTGYPRPPRARDARSSFSGPGRGRGGFRGGYMNGGRHYMGMNGYPPEYVNGNVYGQGYGMGYPAFYPMPVYGQPGAAFDQMGQMYPMPMYGMPQPGAGLEESRPPPQLNNMQAWLYAQVEYYFSMQNLAMDEYLRRQMDSEGWINISVIASFNRIKATTDDVDLVRTVMQASPNLEVHEQKVRLRNPETRRQWILPSAEPSTVVLPEVQDKSSSTEDGQKPNGTLGPTAAEPIATTPQQVAKDIENALMKSSSATAATTTTTAASMSAVPSSSVSVTNAGDEGTDKLDDTPGTSMSGDRSHVEEGKDM